MKNLIQNLIYWIKNRKVSTGTYINRRNGKPDYNNWKRQGI